MNIKRKRTSTKGILNASNWVRENVHKLNGQEMKQTAWCKVVSDGSGEQLTIRTAIEILESNGVRTGRKLPEDNPLGQRVQMLEQAVGELIRTVDELQRSPYDEPGQLPLKSYPQKTYPQKNESEVADVFSRV